jgi:integrase
MATKVERLPKTDQGWQAWLQNQKPPEARRWVAMGGGLTVCLEEGGGKTFQARVRRIGDKNPRRINIGHFPECSVSQARQRVSETRAAAKEGRDPALDRRRAREGLEEIATFGTLVDLYLERRAESGGLRHKTLEIETQALAPLSRALGERLLSDLEPRDFSGVIEREASRLRKNGRTGRLANMMLAAAKRVFKDARGRGDFTGSSPAAELKRPAVESPRERVLYDGRVLRDMIDPELNETGRLVAALKSADEPGPDHGTRVALLLGLLLGMRAGEVAALEWSAVRLDDPTPVLVIVTGKTKAATRTLPLPPQAVAILRTLRAAADSKARHVFPARSGAGRAEHLHAESLSRAFSRLCASLKIEGAVLHDLRRTCLSGIVEITGDETLAERIAGHKGKSTLARHYDRSKRLEPMLGALSAWAEALDAAAARAALLALPPPAGQTVWGAPNAR